MVHICYRNVNKIFVFFVLFYKIDVCILSYSTVHLHCLKASHCDCIMSFICDSPPILWCFFSLLLLESPMYIIIMHMYYWLYLLQIKDRREWVGRNEREIALHSLSNLVSHNSTLKRNIRNSKCLLFKCLYAPLLQRFHKVFAKISYACNMS